MFPAVLFFLLKVSLSGSAAVTRVPCCPGVLKLYHTQNRGSACQHRPLSPSFNNLKYAAIHMDVVHPISDGKLHPDAGPKTLIPSAQGRAHCQNTALIWGLFLVTNELLRPCCSCLKGSFRGDLRSRFRVKSNCAMLSLWVNLLFKRSDGYVSNASSAEFRRLWRAQVRPL